MSGNETDDSQKKINGGSFVVDETKAIDPYTEEGYSFYRHTFKQNKALIFFYLFTILTLILSTINFLRFQKLI